MSNGALLSSDEYAISFPAFSPPQEKLSPAPSLTLGFLPLQSTAAYRSDLSAQYCSVLLTPLSRPSLSLTSLQTTLPFSPTWKVPPLSKTGPRRCEHYHTVMCIRHTWGLDVVGLPRPSSFGLKVLSVERNMAEASICQEVRSRTLTSSETAQRAPSWHRCVHLRHCPVPSISCAASTLHPHAHACAHLSYTSAPSLIIQVNTAQSL